MSTYTIGNQSIGFSLDSIRKRYPNKDEFVADMLNANPKANKKELTKVLDEVWGEAFPEQVKASKENAEKTKE